MNDIQAATPPPPATGATFSGTEPEEPAMNPFKKGLTSFAASFHESLRYVKAFFVGWGKKITAKNEKEAAEADLLTAKMQVEASEAAENAKNKLDNQSN